MTDLKTLTYETALSLLEEVVAEKGEDYVYTTDPETLKIRGKNGTIASCYYYGLNGAPGCIVGHLIHKLNPDVNLRSIRGLATTALFHAGYSTDSYETKVLIRTVQAEQDSGRTWGAALAEAKEASGQ